ncbi:hypothetical protein [Streptomyces sp. NPDC005989]|uniref:hypothetical protein n=1 Tax=Streptomyces sp. NPDC005989 TaxID=3156727 RepID=UPI0033EC7347
MTLPSHITMPGQVRSVAAQDASGPLYVTGYGTSPLEELRWAVGWGGHEQVVTKGPRRDR